MNTQLLPLITLPADSLRRPSLEISAEEIALPAMQDFFSAMIPSMYAYSGIGLAAPQVNRNIQACVIGKESVPKTFYLGRDDLILLNVKIFPLSKKRNSDQEGCLSVPGTFGDVGRYKDLRVIALDRNGKPLEFEAHNFFARVIQHEYDHLQGTLFVDRAKKTFEVKPDERERILQARQI